jgi:WD40 repeat protein
VCFYKSLFCSETGIKLVNMIDVSQVKLLKGSATALKSVVYDRVGTYVAATACDGNVHVWDSSAASTNAPVTSLNYVPKEAIDSENVLKCSWSSDFLAIPSDSGVYLINRPSWDVHKKLEKDLDSPVSVVSFSPNGKYLACGTMNAKIVVFDVDSSEPIGFAEAKGICCSIAWSPNENALICSNALGHLIRWENVIPRHLKGPMVESRKHRLEEETVEGEEEEDDVEKPKRKRLKKASEISHEVDVLSEDDMDNVDRYYDYSDQGYDEDDRREEDSCTFSQLIPTSHYCDFRYFNQASSCVSTWICSCSPIAFQINSCLEFVWFC